MKRILPLTLLITLLLSQCKKKDEPAPQPGSTRETDVIGLSVDGVDAQNIEVGKDLIVIRLPENYAGGDFIKPHITFGVGYSTRSELVNGFSYQGKQLSLRLESTVGEARTYNIYVIPYQSVELTEPPGDHQIILGPDAAIPVPAVFKGTAQTVNDSGRIVEHPVVVLKNKATGAMAHWLYPDLVPDSNDRKFRLLFPATIAAGDYTAEVVWGGQRVVLSDNITIKPGPLQLKRSKWYMSPSSRYFELTGFNIGKEGKYELTLANDFTETRKIPLHFKNAGTLTGTLPADLGTGNYKATYWKDGKAVEPYDETGIGKYTGEDQFYLKKTTDQPVLKIISQPSRRRSFDTGMGFSLEYYPSFVRISRNEPLLAYRERSGPFPDRNDLVLVDTRSRKEYTIPYSGNAYGIFDGFMVFFAYNIPEALPAGKYEAYMITGSDKTEKYSQLITVL
ncbi:hypothetical protein [Dyadobacter sp. 676]|uniref:Uncharacterized protein n=1 Tax=Dyadobacter sp. 676 TaxID=3088362 RepID=A0AAU8FK06_9BACT